VADLETDSVLEKEVAERKLHDPMDRGVFVTSRFGIRMPRIIYGTAWKKTRTEELVTKAIRQGFRGVDTACQPKHYFEAGVGAAVAACVGDALARADLYLQTKFTPLPGQDPNQVPYDVNASLSEQVTQSFYASRRNLQTGYLDCLVLHSPLPRLEQTLEVWQAMEELFDSGGVRQLGISNCYDMEELKSLHLASRVKPAVLQNRFYAETGYDKQIRAFCRANDIAYQSFWTLTANPRLLAHRAVKRIASAHGRTSAQVVFRFLTQEGVTPLTGTKSESHMREDLDIFSFELTASERNEINALLE
jgi:diketogulonate reductase-like aldo/keto reductase